ncbi:unnamed protein product [Cochlearia groenlandica]
MLGDFIIRFLVLILGYTYPAFECFKTVEKNKVDIEELRFWCQYWILLAFISSFERVGDIFISWLPLYGEMKVVFFVYLWYPKTKGTRHVYERLLKPYIAKHETEIDRKIMELRARAWDFFVFYFHNFAQSAQSTFMQAFQHLLAQSVRFSASPNQPVRQCENAVTMPPTPPATPGRDSAKTFNGEGINIPDTIPGSPITDARSKLTRSSYRPQSAG